MVKLSKVTEQNAALVQQRPLVAVFFGGTNGIGQYALLALAKANSENKGKGFRAYIVGRSAEAAEKTIESCKESCPDSSVTFIKVADLSLLKQVDGACDAIQQAEAKQGDDARIDFLMLTQGGAIFQPRNDTAEGLDKTMSLMYYSRMRAINNLAPLLTTSKSSSSPSTVVSVFAAGFEEKIIAEDLSLRKPSNYSYLQVRWHAAFMHTLFFESLAQQHAGKVKLIHIFPGLVLGPAFANPELPAWFRLFWRWIFAPLFGRLASVPEEESVARMVGLMASPAYAPYSDKAHPAQDEIAASTRGPKVGGSYALNWDGENRFKVKPYAGLDKDDLRDKVWKHTMEALEVIASGKPFTA